MFYIFSPFMRVHFVGCRKYPLQLFLKQPKFLSMVAGLAFIVTLIFWWGPWDCWGDGYVFFLLILWNLNIFLTTLVCPNFMISICWFTFKHASFFVFFWILNLLHFVFISWKQVLSQKNVAQESFSYFYTIPPLVLCWIVIPRTRVGSWYLSVFLFIMLFIWHGIVWKSACRHSCVNPG